MKRRILALITALVMVVTMLPASAFAENTGNNKIILTKDTENLFTEYTESFNTKESYWGNVVNIQPEGYSVTENTVEINTAEALVWLAKRISEGDDFKGKTININSDLDMSSHYWTPISTAKVERDENNSPKLTDRNMMNNVIINGNGHKISGIAVNEGVRGPAEGSKPGDGQNAFYYAAFIGYNSDDITIKNITFDKSTVAITKPEDGIAKNGSSQVAVVVAHNGGNGSLCLENVDVQNSRVFAVQKASALVGYSPENLTVKNCSIENNKIIAYFQAAPIAGYISENKLKTEGLILNNNTIEMIEQEGSQYEYDNVNNLQFWIYEGKKYLNGSTTALYYDLDKNTDFVAEYDGFLYETLSGAVNALVNSETKSGTVTLLKNASGGGIGLFNSKGHKDVDLTIDFGGYTYTMTDPAVGSPGTESQVFHFEKDNKVTLKNGTVKVDDSSNNAIMLIQNYSNLNLENLNLVGGVKTQYILSSNYGDTAINNVNINGKHSDLVAIDLMHWLGTVYKDKAPTMVINNDENHIINGAINVYCSEDGSSPVGCTDKPEEKIESGVFNTNPKEYSGNEIVARTSGNFYVGNAASSRIRSLSEGDKVEIINGSSVEVPEGVKVTNSTGAPITVNGETVANGGTVIAEPEEPPVIVYPVISRIAAIADQEYTGSAITPDLTVYDQDGEVITPNNYTATYTNNIEPGTATVTVTGKAGVLGSATATFTIVKKEDPQPPQPEKPGKVEITKTSSDFGRIRVYFDKVAAVGDNTMRYQIQSQKVGSDVVKTQYATVGYSYATVRDLAYNAKYNIKVRAYYVDENGERIYGDWSEVKTVYANRLGTANQVMYKAGITKLTAGKTSVAVNLKKVAFTKKPVKITYQIAYKKKGATKFSYAYTTNLKKTVYNLSKNTNYQFKVRYYYKSLVDDKLVFSPYTALKTVKTAK